jgi:hypothetical protein
MTVARNVERPPAPAPADPFPLPPGAGGQPRLPPPPKAKPSKIGIVLTALVAAAVVAVTGLGVRTALRPDPCQGAAFVSSTYGYCVTPPTGWTASSATQEFFGVDAFRNTTSPVVVYVDAIQLGSEDLDAVTAEVRQLDEGTGGVTLSDVESSTLGGEPTREWTVTEQSPQGGRSVREILVVRDDVAWRIEVADVEGAPDQDYTEAQQLLDSFRFAGH